VRPDPRMHSTGRLDGSAPPAAAWLALPSLRLELAEQLQLREQNRLLEISCSWPLAWAYTAADRTAGAGLGCRLTR
jgi:hypothetical protein